MADFISYLFAIFVITPLQAEISDRMQGIPSDLIAAGRQCVLSEGPNLLERAQQNWGWAAANGLGVAAGLVDPLTLLPRENEDCRVAINAITSREADA